MRSIQLLLALSCIAAIACLHASEAVMRVVRTQTEGPSLLRNGEFTQMQNGALAAWRAAPRGYRIGTGEGRGNSPALACENPNGDGWHGASQTVVLNRANVAPLIIRGWSKAKGVSGGTDSGYSLYVDILYSDGTPLWGQTANFRCGTHDWEERERIILPEKPVKSLTVHCLFRGHAGTVWFDDVSLEEVRAQGNAVLFQGVPVQVTAQVHTQSRSPDSEEGYATQDGLALVVQGGTLVSLRAGEEEFSAVAPAGFLARDVAANSDFFDFSGGMCSDLGLKVRATFQALPDHVSVQGRLTDLTDRDRAVTLVFAMPLDATGWQWGEDVRRSRRIEGRGEFMSQVSIRGGATGTMSLYPLAAVWNEKVGLALALDMARPAVYRVGYHAGTKHLFMAYDFGLVQETKQFPGSADFRFVLYRFDPAWGFRAAFGKLMRLFPDYFEVRSKEQGIWMPFTDVSTVEGWEDFGFRYHEGNNNVPFDDAHGILSFRYSEPMTWWMTMPKEAPRTLVEAERIRDAMATSGSGRHRRMARALQVAGMRDEADQPCLLFRNEPWCHGAVWSLNPNPWLGGDPGETLNAATVYWNDDIQQSLYGPEAKGRLDGEYLDSLEGYVTAELNFRRDHFRDTRVPLTFSSAARRPALFKGLAVFEFTQWISEDVHRLGKLTFANGVPYRFAFLCPWLDVMGTETDWLRGGTYQPSSDPQMCLWRTMSGQKPYLILMNTDYDRFTPEWVERYFQRALFYGMFPGMFSHNAAENPYWKNPRWYNRDRVLFKKYIPLVKRVAEAGWEPVTRARCNNETIWVERFGPDQDGAVYVTLFNDTDRAERGTVRVEPGILGAADPKQARELISGEVVRQAGGGWRVVVGPREVRVLAWGPKDE